MEHLARAWQISSAAVSWFRQDMTKVRNEKGEKDENETEIRERK